MTMRGGCRAVLARSARTPPRRGRIREYAGVLAAGLGDDHRRAGIGFSRIAMERHRAEERHADALRLVLGAAMAENVRALAAMRAEEIAHVLDDAEHRHVDALEHVSPFRASISARSCGVETITAPASGTCCAIVSCASPVPGGMSTTRMSSSPHATSRSICVSADCTIGPRQIIGVSSSTRNPIDMTFSP